MLWLQASLFQCLSLISFLELLDELWIILKLRLHIQLLRLVRFLLVLNLTALSVGLDGCLCCYLLHGGISHQLLELFLAPNCLMGMCCTLLLLPPTHCELVLPRRLAIVPYHFAPLDIIQQSRTPSVQLLALVGLPVPTLPQYV